MVKSGKVINVIFVMFILSCGVLYADESVNLSTSVPVSSAMIQSNLTLNSLYIDKQHWIIIVNVGDGTYTTNFQYSGTKAQQLIRSLNTANFTTTSLTKTIYNQLVTDGFIQGSVTGTPN